MRSIVPFLIATGILLSGTSCSPLADSLGRALDNWLFPVQEVSPEKVRQNALEWQAKLEQDRQTLTDYLAFLQTTRQTVKNTPAKRERIDPNGFPLSYNFVTELTIRELTQEAATFKSTAEKTAGNNTSKQEQAIMALSSYVKAFAENDYSYDATIRDRISGSNFRSYDSEAPFWNSLETMALTPEFWKKILSRGIMSREAATLWLQAKKEHFEQNLAVINERIADSKESVNSAAPRASENAVKEHNAP